MNKFFSILQIENGCMFCPSNSKSANALLNFWVGWLSEQIIVQFFDIHFYCGNCGLLFAISPAQNYTSSLVLKEFLFFLSPHKPNCQLKKIIIKLNLHWIKGCCHVFCCKLFVLFAANSPQMYARLEFSWWCTIVPRLLDRWALLVWPTWGFKLDFFASNQLRIQLKNTYSIIIDSNFA